jgi:lysyl-tRNA synthetase class 1
MHWAEVFANRLIKQDKKQILATGITPSGPIHIGNMREVITTDAVYRLLIEKGSDAELIYIADDFDHLRKLYPYLPKIYENYIGMSISEIPCPCGKHKNYADHYLYRFLESLKEIGITPKVYRAYDLYKSGFYKEAIQIALDNSDKIRKIIEKISKRKLQKNWLPFNIKCKNCKKLTNAKPVLYEGPYIEYKCSCGFEGQVDIKEGGVGKLPWRVDWPARWKLLNITFEPFGKDLATTGGARDTGEVISKEIYNYTPPEYISYEFILLKGKGAMHSSKGTALSSEQMLNMTPPEVLRFLIMKNQPNKHILFDPGFGVLNLVDEYDQQERVYFGIEEKIKGMKDLKRTYELSQPHNISENIPFQLPYRHLVTLIQICKKWQDVKKILIRNNLIPDFLSKQDDQLLKKRSEHASYWLDNFAPENVKFKVKESLPKIKLEEIQIKFLKNFILKIKNIRWNADDIHNLIYKISEETNIPINISFKTVYQIILGQEKGPRAGFFLSNLDKEFVLMRCKEAIN